ncbi:MAG: class I SAM-dependent methyltransferase [Kiloniellales bacterium]
MTGESAGPKSAAIDWNPDDYVRDAGFVPELGLPLLDLLRPRPSERILDLGCGDGTLTLRLVEAGASVLAVDASAEQIAAARARGLDALVVDGTALTFDHEFDAVFSNAALHWMRPPDKVVDGVWRALKPGGRFVGEMGGAGNIALVVAALEAALTRRAIDFDEANPWFFPGPEGYRALLETQGFRVRDISHFARPTALPGALPAWLDIFAQSYLALVPVGARPAIKDEVSAALAPKLKDQDGSWTVDYVRLRFAAEKPA